jgi:hypothetical protein
MALKAILDSLDTVPEAQRGLYTEKDGKFILDLEGIEDHPGAKSLKNALEMERKERLKRQDRIDELTKEAEKFKDLDPDRAREALAKVLELGDKELMDAGKIDELVDQRTERMRADSESQRTTLEAARDTATTERDTARERLAKEVIDNRIMVAATEAGVRKGAMPDVLSRARMTWRLDDAGEPAAFKDDNRIFGSDGSKPMTMTEWVSGLSSDAEHLFEPNKGGGAQGGTADKDGISIISPSQAGGNLEKIASGEVQLSE